MTTPATPDGVLPELPTPRGFLHLYNTWGTAYEGGGSVQQVHGYTAAQMHAYARAALEQQAAALQAAMRDAERLDFIERTFSGMTNRERYLPVRMIWGKGANGRTLREACDKYMKREAARLQPLHGKGGES